MTARRANQIFNKFFLKATGIDLDSPLVKIVDVRKITISTAWYRNCLDTTLDSERLNENDRLTLGLLILGQGPYVSETQEEDIKLMEGAVTYADAE